MSFRTLSWILPLALVLAGCTRDREAPQQLRPDVIFLTIDTTRADHLSVYGYERRTSPVLEKLAKQGLLFERAWSTSSWTLPSHASMFTGLHPTTHGAHFTPEGEEMFHNRVSRLGEHVRTLAEILRDQGYATAALAGGPWLAPEFGLLQGYEFQHAGLKDGSSLVATDRPKQKIRVDWAADELTDRAIAWLQTIPRERPVHLMVNYFDPHFPYRRHKQFSFTSADAESDQAAAKIDAYDSEIRFMDHHLGRLLDALAKLGRFGEALIVVVADHGESFGEHGNEGHGPWLYEEILRVPLIVKLPAAERAGDRVDAPVSVVDLLPLILGELGLEVPAASEGVPIGERDLVVGEAFRSEALNTIAPDRYDRDVFAGIRWPWKVLLSDRGDTELYDIARDPNELDDRSDEAVANKMKARLSAALEKLSPPQQPELPKSVDPALKERLRALGYGN